MSFPIATLWHPVGLSVASRAFFFLCCSSPLSGLCCVKFGLRVDGHQRMLLDMLQSNNVFLLLISTPYNSSPGTRRSFRRQAQSALTLQIWILDSGGLES